MKLYTEEQVKQIVEKSRETGLTAEYLMLTTTPTELYTEEDIQKTWNAAYIDALKIDEEDYKPLFYQYFLEQLKQSKV